ncbi:MAG TPA: FeoB small GTPase domain-containing protein, partial [Candidatus Dormibacteraeota bacterium]|nr:FeoB small GTPase domain-containing protein [Candidatus Dormibacteraeota bacterium]
MPAPGQFAPRSARPIRTRQIVLAGNPNSGKTTLFNALTGLRAKVGNYPGVTVERKEGRLLKAPADQPVMVLDLPGTYSLSPQSLDEQVARDVLFHRVPDVPPPDVIVVVVDASNLQRNLYFATQVIELGYPTCLALNMVDVATANGHEIDVRGLEGRLGVSVIPLVASTGKGVAALRERLLTMAWETPEREDEEWVKAESGKRKEEGGLLEFGVLPAELDREAATLTGLLQESLPKRRVPKIEALLLLGDERFLAQSGHVYSQNIAAAVRAARTRLEQSGI